eukprot:CAMPEP_0202867400 /NCGR_PEP_ID=MMETSP1391-20130828/9359_1 /ASSEMBLY_ACC=CAM_ASM_000867 /TAXON_ID=1034604 /ORGANISM="Chlamydomonas leiostraca, Strain SAG 11-49" /LENGTH=189 /DNA_ID=CAMNT_0049547443 /DNA_START=71 /DNA_END=637 /DNA_ORIENTATION=-
MGIVCAAVVGQQNQPLYLKTYPAAEGEQLLKFHYIVHCSLDAVEEKVLLKRPAGEVPDPYLGLLYPTEEFKVYGYLTNTAIKLLVVLDDASAKEEAVTKALRRMHTAYVDTASNPFFAFGLPITSAKFDALVDAAVEDMGGDLADLWPIIGPMVVDEGGVEAIRMRDWSMWDPVTKDEDYTIIAGSVTL